MDETNNVWQAYGNHGCAVIKPPSDWCPYNYGKPFIRFDIHDYSTLTSPPTLTIDTCTFKNFVYEYDSFIKLN